MIAARWTDAKVGGDRITDHTAPVQDGGEGTVAKASKTLNVGARGIYHAKYIIENGTPEAAAAVEIGPAERASRELHRKCAEIQLG